MYILLPGHKNTCLCHLSTGRKQKNEISMSSWWDRIITKYLILMIENIFINQNLRIKI